MTMTREEMLATLVQIHALLPKAGIFGWARGQDALSQAIAALSAQEQEPWGWEWVDGSDTGVVTLRQDYEKYKRDYPRMTFTALYAAPPAQADTKQAEPVRVSRNRLYKAWNAMERASNAYEMLAVLHQLGAKVEVSDG